MKTKGKFFVRLILGAALGVAVAVRASAADPVVVQSASNGYNAWPIVQAVGGKIVCAYSRGTAHHISQGVRGVYARVSSDGGVTWGDEVTVVNDAAYGEVAIISAGTDHSCAAGQYNFGHMGTVPCEGGGLIRKMRRYE